MITKIALLGFGTVGKGLCEILKEKEVFLKKKYGFEYKVVAVADRTYGNVYNPDGLNIDTMIMEAMNGAMFTKDVVELDNLNLIKECNADIICELTYTNLKDGGAAIEHCKAALSTGKHIVTSNKGPVALYYPELKKLADENEVKFMIEGTVVAGTPVINLANGPLAGCEVTKIRGILNGTTNFILSEMEKGKRYVEVLELAQKLGYAEADPSGDVDGLDARGKVTILANIVMDAGIKITDVSCKGISKITLEDVQNAQKQNARYKLIGTVEKKNGKVVGSVAPEMVDINHPLGAINGVTNALTFTTDLLGDITIIGPGAGKKETGFSILTDILAIHRSTKC
jgi:homoserine dehydrogenase